MYIQDLEGNLAPFFTVLGRRAFMTLCSIMTTFWSPWQLVVVGEVTQQLQLARLALSKMVFQERTINTRG